jgi:hypothetical protein
MFRTVVKLTEDECMAVMQAFSTAQREDLMTGGQAAVARKILHKFPDYEKFYYHLKDEFGNVPNPNPPSEPPPRVDTSIIDEIFVDARITTSQG